VQKDYSDELKKESAAIKKSADLNTAAASLKLHCYKEAIAAASKVHLPYHVLHQELFSSSIAPLLRTMATTSCPDNW